MMEFPPPTATIRHCVYRELNGIIPIYNHYVSNTVASLDIDAKPLLYAQNLYNSVHDQGLPFLVVTASNDDDPARRREDILGYAYAHFYRRLAAYGGTVEVLIYLEPSATGQGIGEKLLSVLLDTLRAVAPGTDREHGIREVLAVVPVDEGRDASRFFLREGFEDRGLLKGVAWKMGRWVDTRTFQRSLGDEPKNKEKAVQRNRAPERHWWSSLFRRRRRRGKRKEEEQPYQSNLERWMEMTAWKAEGRGATILKQFREVDGDDGVESGRRKKNANVITIYWAWLGYRSLEEWTESKEQSLQDSDVQGYSNMPGCNALEGYSM